MAAHLAGQAQRDLKKLQKGNPRDYQRCQKAILDLEGGAANLDIVPISGRPPWMRLRDGDWRVLFRRVNPDEHPDGGNLVARVVNRRDLDDAVRQL
jgi:hypothetical protein